MPNKGKPLVVEFVGLPGSGKTTVAEAVREKLQREKTVSSTAINPSRQRRDLVEKIRMFPEFVVFCTRFHSYFGLGLLALFYSRRDWTRKVKRLINIAAYMFLEKKYLGGLIAGESNYIILDEGPVHHLWSFFYSSGAVSEKIISGMISGVVSLSRIYIYMDCDKDEMISRVLGRDTQSRFDLMSREELRKAYDLGELNYLLIEQSMQQIGVEIFRVDSSGSLGVEEAVRAIMTVLSKKKHDAVFEAGST